MVSSTPVFVKLSNTPLRSSICIVNENLGSDRAHAPLIAPILTPLQLPQPACATAPLPAPLSSALPAPLPAALPAPPPPPPAPLTVQPLASARRCPRYFPCSRSRNSVIAPIPTNNATVRQLGSQALLCPTLQSLQALWFDNLFSISSKTQLSHTRVLRLPQ